MITYFWAVQVFVVQPTKTVTSVSKLPKIIGHIFMEPGKILLIYTQPNNF
jgi:hypothetical protein